jgi:hypothetical protein
MEEDDEVNRHLEDFDMWMDEMAPIEPDNLFDDIDWLIPEGEEWLNM